MQEVLEKIRQAEAENDRLQAALVQQLRNQEKQQEQLFTEQSRLMRQEVAAFEKAKETLAKEQLELEKKQLLAEAEKTKQLLKAQYEAHHHQVLEEIIAKVRAAYGSR